ncbi:MAG TPA: hypothetical protein VGR76_13335 [Candidatus Angelobacter sp.]|jgi:hypothetical protein|nr:hypothetical protein [Candidatus Angelobacter sp.]
MESQNRLWTAIVLLSDALYTVAIFGGYAALSRLLLPVRQAA